MSKNKIFSAIAIVLVIITLIAIWPKSSVKFGSQVQNDLFNFVGGLDVGSSNQLTIDSSGNIVTSGTATFATTTTTGTNYIASGLLSGATLNASTTRNTTINSTTVLASTTFSTNLYASSTQFTLFSAIGASSFASTLGVSGLLSALGGITIPNGVSLSASTTKSGTLTQGGGVVSTSSSADLSGLTLIASNFASADLINITSGTTTVTLTVTLPASSTLSAIAPNAGDMRDYIVYAASTTGGTLTMAGGTGTTLQSASSTSVIGAGDTALLRLVRLSNSNIIARLINAH